MRYIHVLQMFLYIKAMECAAAGRARPLSHSSAKSSPASITSDSRQGRTTCWATESPAHNKESSMYSHSSFKKKLIASAVASCALASLNGVAYAQGEELLEEVVVRGVRAAQETAVSTKRDAVSVVDAISAEDIGKLPDVTISDSLQRIPGIQIRRSAGEGSSINIRGLPQVVTQLNGEQYLGANSVVSTQPNFGDIPSQLFKGADIHKSSTANLGNTGITGTVNLKTYRPFDFDEGLTFAGGAEIQTGEE